MKSKFVFMLMMATVLAVAATVKAGVVLPEGVDEYRIIFTTMNDFQATSTDIGWYNTQVTEQMQLSGQLHGLSIGHDLDWHCVGSTETVDARDNISPGIAWDAENVPIYNTHGLLVANNLADLFDGSIVKHVNYNQWGEVMSYTPHFEVWTGTDEWGCKNTNTIWDGGALGSTSVIIGDSRIRDEAWLRWAWDDSQVEHHLYGISSPIPEPSTIALLGIAGFGLFLGRNKVRR